MSVLRLLQVLRPPVSGRQRGEAASACVRWQPSGVAPRKFRFGSLASSFSGGVNGLGDWSLLHLVRSRVWEKLPVMTLNSYPFDDHKEEESKCIGRYPIPYKKDLPFDIVELMEEIEKKTGFLPNAFKALSYRPSEFRAFFAYYNAIYNKETGGLSKADKELIIVVTSLSEKCLYTVVVHSALYRVHSKDPVLSDQVCVNWRKSNLPAREKAMVEFALVVSKADDVTDDHFKKLEMHGFNQEDAWDIAIISAFYAMTRRLINFANVIPNKEFYSMGRTSNIKHIHNDVEV